ncbi:hypothetical protein ACLX1H_005546 [Fusarium chlamydosporum]
MRKMVQKRFEHSIRICKVDLQCAQSAVKTAIEQIMATEARLRDREVVLKEAKRLVAQQADLLSQGSSLLTQSSGLLCDIERAEDELTRINANHSRAARIVGKWAKRAEEAGYIFPKAAHASCILTVIDIVLEDDNLTSGLAEIVKDLSEHDDARGSVRQIITGQHLDGLLAGVEQRLEQIHVGDSGSDTSASEDEGPQTPTLADSHSRFPVLNSMNGFLGKDTKKLSVQLLLSDGSAES